MARRKSKNTTVLANFENLHALLIESLQLANDREFEKANPILDGAYDRYQNSPIFHRVNAAVRLAQSASHDDVWLKESLCSAKTATVLAPSNLELSVFYVQGLVLYAWDFGSGIQECERALSVPNPVVLSDDERFQGLELEGDAGGVITVEGRTEFCRRRIRFLKGLAKSAIIDLTIVCDFKKCMLLLRKRDQERTQFEQKVNEENPKRVEVKSYLESLTAVAMRKSLIEIDVLKLKEYSTLYPEANAVLSEALHFANENHTWKFWFCPICDEKLGDLTSHWNHVVKEHVGGGFSGEQEKLLPEPVSQQRGKMLVDESRLPLDVDAVISLLGQKPASTTWFLSNDEKKAKLLKKIEAIFRMLLKFRYLSASHLDKVLNYAMNRAKANPSMSLLIENDPDIKESLLCIRVLDECHLTEITKFLDHLLEACKLGKYCEEESFCVDHDVILDALDSANDTEELGMMFLDCASSKLIIDPRAFCKESGHNKAGCSCSNDGIWCKLDVEAVVSWLYKGKPWNDESLTDWAERRKLKTSWGGRILWMLQQEFQLVRDLCTAKCEHLAYVDVLKHVEQCCREEKNKRGNVETEFLSCEAILMKVKEDASMGAERNGEVTQGVKAVFDVLKAVQIVKECATSYEEEAHFMGMYLELLYEEESIELHKIDAKILRSLSKVEQLKFELPRYCSLDFLSVLAPLVKFYLQTSLEVAAEKFGRDKPNAACKPHLEEEGDIQHTNECANHPRRSQKKPKGKKKSNHSKK